MAINTITIIISGVAYVVATTLLQLRHRRNILNEFSNTDKITLDWIQYLVCGIGLIWIFVIFSMDDFVYGTAVLFVLFIGYFGIRQIGIFHPRDPQERQAGIENPTEKIESESIIPDQNEESSVIDANFEKVHVRKKYAKSGLTAETASELHERLNVLMITEKTFCDSELTLFALAKKMGTHPNYLSQVINEKEGKNFFDYVNTLRTEEFKKLIADPGKRKFTLLSLAFECGFNSKSSFNKYFKKVTGSSPSEYMQQLNVEVAA